MLPGRLVHGAAQLGHHLGPVGGGQRPVGEEDGPVHPGLADQVEGVHERAEVLARAADHVVAGDGDAVFVAQGDDPLELLVGHLLAVDLHADVLVARLDADADDLAVGRGQGEHALFVQVVAGAEAGEGQHISHADLAVLVAELLGPGVVEAEDRVEEVRDAHARVLVLGVLVLDLVGQRARRAATDPLARDGPAQGDLGAVAAVVRAAAVAHEVEHLVVEDVLLDVLPAVVVGDGQHIHVLDHAALLVLDHLIVALEPEPLDAVQGALLGHRVQVLGDGVLTVAQHDGLDEGPVDGVVGQQ